MRRMKIILIAGLFVMVSVAALSGCVAGPGGQPAQTAGNNAMTQGRGYFMRECIKCHRYFLPKERTPAEWTKILAGKRSKVSLTGSQFQELSDYVMAESKAAKAP